MAKKQKTRGSEGSSSPWSPGQGSGSPDAETSCTSPAADQQTGQHDTGMLITLIVFFYLGLLNPNFPLIYLNKYY